MKILITGGCGFLGTNLAAHAINNEYDVAILDNLYRNSSYNNLTWLKKQGSFEFKHLDMRNYLEVETAIRKYRPDIIFHLAGQVAMTTSLENPMFDFQVNAMGTLNLLESVRSYSNDAIVVYSSTNKVYGDLNSIEYREQKKRYEAVNYPNGFDENIGLDFQTPYGCSKGVADQYMLDYGRMYDLNTVVFRHSSIYGSRQFSTEDQGWIGWFCQKAIEILHGDLKKPINISGDGKQVRDILYSLDLIRLYFSVYENICKAKGQAFNIGGGFENSYSLLELFSYLEDILNIEIKYTSIPWRKSDQKVFIADYTKAQNIFNWMPKIDKKSGVRMMIEWIMK